MAPKLQTLDEVIYGPSINELGRQVFFKKMAVPLKTLRKSECMGVWSRVGQGGQRLGQLSRNKRR